MPRHFRRALAAILMLVLAPLAIAQGGDTMMDKIVATVDDEVILLSSVLSDVQLFLMQSGVRPDSTQFEQLMRESLENMVKEKIILAKARREGIQVEQEEVDVALERHIAGLVEQSGGEERFDRQLREEGLTRLDLDRRLREPMTEQILVQRLVEGVTFSIQVSEEEAREYFLENQGNREMMPWRPTAVKLSHILVLPRPSEDRQARADVVLEEAKKRLGSGEDFGSVARELSQGPAADRGGDLGWFQLQDIAQPELQEALATMSPGETRDDVLSGAGLHILKLVNRIGARVHFLQIFIPMEITEDDRSLARVRAREVQTFLKDGGSWEEAVNQYSDDDYSRQQGGALPLVPEEQLDERYREVVSLLEPGETSSVFAGLRGYQIVRLDQREEERPFEFDEITEELRSELIGRRRNEALESYLLELEDEIYVDRKGLPDPSELLAPR